MWNSLRPRHSLEQPSTTLSKNALEQPSTMSSKNSLKQPSTVSSKNSLEQPSTTSGGGSGTSDGSSSCEIVTDLRPTRVLSRDYSVDARTDALFHEFVKYDPNLSARPKRPVISAVYSTGQGQYFIERSAMVRTCFGVLRCSPMIQYPSLSAV